MNQFSHKRTAYKTARGSLKLGPVMAKSFMLFAIAAFTMLFLVQTSEGSNTYSSIRSLERQKEELQKEYSSLEVNATRLKSLQTLEESGEKLGLVPVESTSGSIEVN